MVEDTGRPTAPSTGSGQRECAHPTSVRGRGGPGQMKKWIGPRGGPQGLQFERAVTLTQLDRAPTRAPQAARGAPMRAIDALGHHGGREEAP